MYRNDPRAASAVLHCEYGNVHGKDNREEERKLSRGTAFVRLSNVNMSGDTVLTDDPWGREPACNVPLASAPGPVSRLLGKLFPRLPSMVGSDP